MFLVRSLGELLLLMETYQALSSMLISQPTIAPVTSVARLKLFTSSPVSNVRTPVKKEKLVNDPEISVNDIDDDKGLATSNAPEIFIEVSYGAKLLEKVAPVYSYVAA